MKNFIKKVKIFNFKCFKEWFEINLNDGMNIIVGNNEEGKTTILEAIHLALTGVYHGKYLKNELSQELFNKDIVKDYILKINNEEKIDLPKILIEIFFNDNTDVEEMRGNNNYFLENASGISYEISFNNDYKKEYELFINEKVHTLPIEYYKVSWKTFSYGEITAKSIPVKPSFIDSSINRYQDTSDIYTSKIIKNTLSEDDVVKISLINRQVRSQFNNNEEIKKINEKIRKLSNISDKEIKISTDFSSNKNWNNNLSVYLDDVHFNNIGKGEQCVIKTKLALSNKKIEHKDLILIEEPENHLSHTKLNELINDIDEQKEDKQLIISTHSSFIANKLGLENLILLNNKQTIRFENLKDTTYEFFKKIAGFDTLRLLLAKEAILVEGDSDELIVQKAFMEQNEGKLPIEKGIDVISVGTSFLRFLEIAKKLSKKVIVITDNDGDIDSLKKKYEDFIDDENISIYYDKKINEEEGLKNFNYNTLEPNMLKANSLDVLNEIFGTKYKTKNELLKYMKQNKTQCALQIFETTKDIKFPKYIMEAINEATK